ncbi:MAG: lysophospholipid acyltransferase family protein [Rickettsiales bacterium]
MRFLRSALFNVVMFGWTAILLIAYIPLLVGPRRMLHDAVRWWTHTIFFLQRRLLALDFEFRGVENLPEGGYIIASAHQSAWDTIGLYELLEDPVFVLKKELYAIPMFGPYARKCGMVVIDRAGGATEARSMIRRVSERLAEGRPVVIFPGGTRSGPDEIVELKAGIAAMYRRCNVTVVPLSLNSGMFWGRRSFVKTPGKIVAGFGEAIQPGLSAADFSALLSERIHDGNRRLVAEARESLR